MKKKNLVKVGDLSCAVPCSIRELRKAFTAYGRKSSRDIERYRKIVEKIRKLVKE